jgi:hypothetical protein
VRPALTAPQHALHGFEHPARLEWLDDEILGARLDGLDDQRLLPHGAAHQHARRRVELADLPHRIDAAHVRHHDVHRDEVRPQLLVLLHGLHARLRLTDDLETGLLEDVADHGAHEDRVVADQNCMTHSLPP